MKWFDRLDTAIKEFVTLIAPEITVVYGSEFAYYRSSSKVEYTFEPAGLDEFMENLETRCDFASCVSSFIWALLHEIGHHFTIEQVISDPDFDPITSLLVSELDDPKCHAAYWNLPKERAATDWAIEFVRLNPDTVINAANNFNNAMEG